MAGLSRKQLGNYITSKMRTEGLSLRRAAELANCSPATFSRILGEGDDGYMPDIATLNSIAAWLKKDISDFDSSQFEETKTLADVAVHLHALPDLKPDDAKFIMSVVQLLYEDKRQKS